MRIVISSEAEKSSLQTDKGRAKVERGSTQVLFFGMTTESVEWFV